MVRPMTGDEYAFYKGWRCPACREKDIQVRWGLPKVPRYEGFASVRLNVLCQGCGSTWVEIYQPQLVVVGYEELEDAREGG